MVNVLYRLDMRDKEISLFSQVLKKNDQIMENLMKLNKCNLVKRWLIDEERDLCVHATEDLKMVFNLMIFVCVLFTLLILTSVFGYKILKEYSNLQ